MWQKSIGILLAVWAWGASAQSPWCQKEVCGFEFEGQKFYYPRGYALLWQQPIGRVMDMRAEITNPKMISYNLVRQDGLQVFANAPHAGTRPCIGDAARGEPAICFAVLAYPEPEGYTSAKERDILLGHIGSQQPDWVALPQKVHLKAPERAQAGSKISISWQAEAAWQENAHIALVWDKQAKAAPSSFVIDNLARIEASQSPAYIALPEYQGRYRLVYVQDGIGIASRAIEVE